MRRERRWRKKRRWRWRGRKEIEGEEGAEEEEPSGINWAPRVSAKRKAREDFWIDAELEVRRICGYKERRSKKVIERIKERELRETRDIRGMFNVEERGGTSSEEVERVEEEVNYEEEEGKITKKLALGWDHLEQSWKMAIQKRAKEVRTCHENHRKECGQCKWARKRAQREWEEDHKGKVSKKLDTKRYRQSGLQG